MTEFDVQNQKVQVTVTYRSTRRPPYDYSEILCPITTFPSGKLLYQRLLISRTKHSLKIFYSGTSTTWMRKTTFLMKQKTTTNTPYRYYVQPKWFGAIQCSPNFSVNNYLRIKKIYRCRLTVLYCSCLGEQFHCRRVQLTDTSYLRWSPKYHEWMSLRKTNCRNMLSFWEISMAWS